MILCMLAYFSIINIDELFTVFYFKNFQRITLRPDQHENVIERDPGINGLITSPGWERRKAKPGMPRRRWLGIRRLGLHGQLHLHPERHQGG